MTATWTTPRTWATGEIVTAALANEQWRDNVDYLKARPLLIVKDLDGTVASTSSTSFVDLTGASGSITTTGSSRLALSLSAVATASGANRSYWTMLVDGVNQGDATYGMTHGMGGSGGNQPSALFITAALSDGAHTVKIQWRVDGGSFTCTQFILAAWEVG